MSNNVMLDDLEVIDHEMSSERDLVIRYFLSILELRLSEQIGRQGPPLRVISLWTVPVPIFIIRVRISIAFILNN